jgi:hypothetical protein
MMKSTMDMNVNMTETFDPFSRHRSKTDRAGTAAPVAAGTGAAEAADTAQKIEAETRENSPSKPVVEEKPSPTARTGKPFDPFASHASEKKPNDQLRLIRALKPSPAQRLLDWLLADQTRAFISARDICNHGPRITRNRECAIEAAETLEKHGWLLRLETRQQNMKWWAVVRKPILSPIITAITQQSQQLSPQLSP